MSHERARALKQEATRLESISLTAAQLCDIELLLTGAYAPVTRLMTRQDLGPEPAASQIGRVARPQLQVFLEVNAASASKLSLGQRVVLRDDEGAMLAVLTIEDIWDPRMAAKDALPQATEATPQALPTPETEARCLRVGGSIEGIGTPGRHDYPELRVTPSWLAEEPRRRRLQRMILVDSAAELTQTAHQAVAAIAAEIDALVVLQIADDGLQPTDLRLHRAVRECREALRQYPAGRAQLALLPLVSKGNDVHELLRRAAVYGNYGATHCILDPRDYGLGSGAEGSAALSKLSAEGLLKTSMTLISSLDLTGPAGGLTADRGAGRPHASHSRGARRSGRVPGRRGATCFFTGLSGAGKSTVARALAARLGQLDRTVSLLDGDIIRKHLSSELTFSKEHRDLNIRRIGYVASEVTRHAGIAICAPIAPYRITRATVRGMIESLGEFLEIHVSTPIQICEKRDPKGLYAKAHAGLIKDFTGVSDPYEEPEHPEIAIDTSQVEVEDAVARIVAELRARGCLHGSDDWPQTAAG
ncbi:adenylyl-sulfate kinase [Thiorhodococcus minor]|uniref:Adenylyl-sulfate kinase n=1 Tax=Thiorhodococcus minor TaxID=57489 RepID=A0A6M0K0L7_9GAMM|nr:adenylyl-sulfate kinase [Thiorhodococcus minor]